MLEVFGIKNCNTVKKSLTWLEEKKISYEFLDVKKSVLSESLLEVWMNNIPKPFTWENLINKSGMTWRKLPDSEKNIELDKKRAIKLILGNPSIMKRPVILKNKKILTIGFDESQFGIKIL
ncbi:Spx/MgsR family RNA polymerase-binding regulatory protein [Methylophilaceae bacterium]|jgi:arsenate reductase (glutaredoxin)|nr:Spx/MgsR family RNA polymerase-binding regulatory protein [Methylophilaceae bacterium]|tara:strand:- start:2534 stop:2896 length:363 start_codon:yes stop_codon:yes gene_type:complete